MFGVVIRSGSTCQLEINKYKMLEIYIYVHRRNQNSVWMDANSRELDHKPAKGLTDRSSARCNVISANSGYIHHALEKRTMILSISGPARHAERCQLQ